MIGFYSKIYWSTVSTKDFFCLSKTEKCKATEFIKKYICRETFQNRKVPLVPPNKPKAQLPKIMFQNILPINYTFKLVTSANTHDCEQQNLLNQEI